MFGKDNCDNCACQRDILLYLVKSNVIKKEELFYVDAMKDENQDVCDKFDVADKLPHIIIFSDEKLDNIVFERHGEYVGVEELKKILVG